LIYLIYPWRLIENPQLQYPQISEAGPMARMARANLNVTLARDANFLRYLGDPKRKRTRFNRRERAR
jgi:hypothetical protein